MITPQDIIDLGVALLEQRRRAERLEVDLAAAVRERDAYLQNLTASQNELQALRAQVAEAARECIPGYEPSAEVELAQKGAESAEKP